MVLLTSFKTMKLCLVIKFSKAFILSNFFLHVKQNILLWIYLEYLNSLNDNPVVGWRTEMKCLLVLIPFEHKHLQAKANFVTYSHELPYFSDGEKIFLLHLFSSQQIFHCVVDFYNVTLTCFLNEQLSIKKGYHE